MKTQIRLIAGIAYIDNKLEELREEYGDLPEQIDEKKAELEEAEKIYKETESILTEVKDFVTNAKQTLIKLKDKEEELAKKQFQVKNNKEFDAITSEIKHIKLEHEELAVQMRKEGMKEENLGNILEDQKSNFKSLKKELEELDEEFSELKEEQAEELDYLNGYRDKILKQIEASILQRYDKIKSTYIDAAVHVRKGSAKGYRVPHQVLVEMRNNMDKIFIDENSGRILIPEEIHMDEEVLKELIN